MRRSEYLNLATRLLAHVDNGTTDSADQVRHVPIENYESDAMAAEMVLSSSGCRCCWPHL